jgi:hypothetical protein
MKVQHVLMALGLLLHLSLVAQTKLNVAELSLKIDAKSTQSVYYGFAEGDQILLNFESLDKKELKSIEIIEYPSSVKYKNLDVSIIKDLKLYVTRSAVYEFRFYNSAGAKGRTFKVNIQRIPKGYETLTFNTSVKWVLPSDTIKLPKPKRLLEKVDTSVVTVLDRIERVYPKMSSNGSNESWVNFNLPKNEYLPNAEAPLQSKEILSWAYTINVGPSGSAWYNDANKKATTKGLVAAGTATGLVPASYGALALLAIEGVSVFAAAPEGDNINFELLTLVDNIKNLKLGEGNTVVANGREINKTQGSFSFKFTNDNMMASVDVDIKVVAIVLHKTYKLETQVRDKSNDKPGVKVPILIE